MRFDIEFPFFLLKHRNLIEGRTIFWMITAERPKLQRDVSPEWHADNWQARQKTAVEGRGFIKLQI